MFPITTTTTYNNSSIAPGSWRDSHSGKSSPDILRHSSSYSSQNAFDTPVSEPATPDGHLVLPKLRTQSTRVSVKPHHIRSRLPREERSSTSIDLSRSSVELEGLGIYTNLERDSRLSQPRNSVSSYPRSITEIASNTTNRIGQTYIHPRRQLPTSLTPSLSESQRCSIDEGYFSPSNGSLPGFDTAQTPVLDEDSPSFRELKTTRTFSVDLSHNSNKGMTIQRANTDAASNLHGGSWKRLSRRQPLPDSTARAAAIHAARIAFEEKEANKGKKVEVLRKKAPERESRRNNNSQQSPNLSPKQNVNDEFPLQVEKGSRHASVAANLTASFPDNDDDEETDNEIIKTRDRPQTEGAELTRIRSQSPVGTANNWARFMTWSRTRYYKAKRRVSSSHFAVK
jgi:hypothetical protein